MEVVHSINVPTYRQREEEGGGEEEGEDTDRICLQILHNGRYTAHPFDVSSSLTKSPISPFRARELLSSGVEVTVSDFSRCAVLDLSEGYDGLEIMGSEGYMINQFLVARTN